jgi:hypothetical protein
VSSAEARDEAGHGGATRVRALRMRLRRQRRAVNDDDGAATAPLLRLRGTVFAGSFRLSQG